MVPRAEDDPQAQLAPFANPDVARRISAMIDRDLEVPGAEDVTARHRPGPRVVEWEGSTYLLPTVVRCDSPEHPLANREFLFPFAAVVEVPAEDDARRPRADARRHRPHRRRGPAARASSPRRTCSG